MHRRAWKTAADKIFIATFLKEIGGKAPEFADKFVSRRQLLESNRYQLKKLGIPCQVRKAVLRKRNDLAARQNYLNTLRTWEIRKNPYKFDVERVIDGDADT